MIVFLTSAFAADAVGPVFASPVVVWAQAVRLPTPEPYRLAPGVPPFQDGLLFELRFDAAQAALLAPRQTAEPVLQVGSVPAMRFNWDPIGGCLVGFVPGSVDLSTTEVFLGPVGLPERLDPTAAAERRAAARTAGVRARPALSGAPGAPLAVANFTAVHALGMARVAACTATPDDERR